MKLLDQARETYQAEKEKDARREEERRNQENKFVEAVNTWLDDLVRESSVSLKVTHNSSCKLIVFPDGAAYQLEVRVDTSGKVTYRYGWRGNTLDAMPWEKIQEGLCRKVAEVEYSQAQAIAAKLAKTPPITA